MSCFQPVTHVIFDFDGLLVDTENAYTVANSTILSQFGKMFTMEIKCKQMGMKHEEAIGWLLKEVDIEDKITVSEFSKKYDEILHKLFGEARALSGAERLVRHLLHHGIPVAICTGSCSKSFSVKAAKHREWIDLVPLHVLTGDDPEVKFGKPHPDPFLITMNRFPTRPVSTKNVLVFEDSPNGVLSALAAGTQCVMVPDEKIFKPDESFREKITQVLPSLSDFQPELFGLPPFDE